MAAAQALAAEARLPDRLAPLLFLTDPERTPDPCAIAEALPAGAGVVYRTFGAADALETARRLREIADARGLMLLIGLDAALAEVSAADGVHLPEHALDHGPVLRARRPGWILTGAAHGAVGLAAAEAAGLDAALLSPVFPSRSPSAAQSLGVDRFSALARDAGLPVYALGGVGTGNVGRLAGTGAAGIAAVGALANG